MSIELGSGAINKIYLGNTEIKKVYLGSDLIYDKTAAGGFLLDLYPNASAAYSLRQLKTGVTNVVRVRRVSDNTEQDFTPTEITDGTLTTFVGSGDGFISKWYDQSGNALDAIQPTLPRQPQIVSSGSVITENGKPSIHFDGLSDGLISSLTGDSENYVFIGVCNANSGNLLSTYFSAELDEPNFVALGVSTNYYYRARNAAGTINTVNGSAVTADQRLLIGMQNSTLQSIYVDNNSPVTSSQSFGSIEIGNGLGVGRHPLLGGFFSGKMQEAIVYLSDESSNISGMQTNINDFYSIY